MKGRPLVHHTASIVVLSILCAPALGANAPLSVDVENGAGKTCGVDAAFDVNAPSTITWNALTDCEGTGGAAASVGCPTKSETRYPRAAR
jgi:hypothetical protein